MSSFVQSYKIGPVLEAKALRDQLDLARRNSDRVYEQVHGLPYQERPAEDDVIQVDSPTTTVNHHHAAPASSLGTLAKIGLAFAVSGPIGAGLAVAPILKQFLDRPAAAATEVPAKPAATRERSWELHLGK